MEESNVQKQLNELDEKVTLILSLVAKVDNLTQLLKTVNIIEASIQSLFENYDTILNTLDKQDTHISNIVGYKA
ncbi:hypothetical protein V5799_026579 [Amblyomma americanum]|uniref:Uncharacterized protein n=1 Tax=Amblyomma americanum TaxID=6943 RepID=A0AAQ4DI64_AMBAM